MPLCAFALALLLPAPALAQNTITNVMSPVASYQYYDALGESTNMPVASSVVSYQFYDSLTDLGTNSVIVSPIVSYQYFDWPGSGILNLQSSPVVSYYYQSGGGVGPLVIHGRVTDGAGAGVAGATVSATVGLNLAVQAQSDANGNYELPELGAGAYMVWVSATGHQSSLRAFTLNGSTAQEDFQLADAPPQPTLTQVNRQATLSYTVGPMGSALVVFDGSGFVPITAENAPVRDRMTIVMTHGWNSSAGVWAAGMAGQMRTQAGTPVTTAMANILAWDWPTAASGAVPEERTLSQGVALGVRLQATLGAGYSQKLHFIGHSLGALVNAAAVNYLHGERTAQQEVSGTPWLKVPVHVTLFDAAEAASALELAGGATVLYDGVTVSLRDSTDLVQGFDGASFGYKSAMPLHSDWADNYVSLAGFYQPDAVNVFLEKAALIWGAEGKHRYPSVWYGLTIANPTGATLGFQRSYEARVAGATAFDFPPSGSDFPPGVSYRQPITASDPLTLSLMPAVNVYRVYGMSARAVVQVAAGAVQVANDVTAEIMDGAQVAQRWAAQGWNYVGSLAAEGQQTVMSIYDSAALRFTFHTRPPGPRPLDVGDGDPRAWIPLVIPGDAPYMAFDFAVQGNPMNDVVVCGIGDTNLFTLEAKYVPTNGFSSSRLIDVSAWSGQQVELFLAFAGGTSSGATLQVQNIRFYSLQPPSLSVQVAGGSVVLTWPSSTGGYALECRPTLAGANWQTITNAPVISGSSYAMTNAVSGGSMFYRLRKQ